MYKHVLKGKESKIRTGFVTDMSEVEVIIVEQRADFIHTINKYPNGFILETKQWKDRIETYTNYPIAIDENGELFIDMNGPISP